MNTEVEESFFDNVDYLGELVLKNKNIFLPYYEGSHMLYDFCEAVTRDGLRFALYSDIQLAVPKDDLHYADVLIVYNASPKDALGNNETVRELADNRRIGNVSYDNIKHLVALSQD